MRCVIVHYHELALKGRNRPYFENMLTGNIRRALKGTGVLRVDTLQGRLRVMLPEEVSWPTVRDRLARVFGISHVLLAHSVPLPLTDPNLQPLHDAVVHAVEHLTFASFRVSAKRAEKRLPFTSMDVEREVGAQVHERTGKPVSLKSPALTITLELVEGHAYYSVEREPGPGGLPVGVSGTVACLISGGIDSPIAALRMMKRGCRAVFVHFHGRPYVSRASEEKVRELVELLTASQDYSRLYLVPFGDLQRQIVVGAPAAYRIVLYRRMMVRIAEELARKEGCWALVTGESLGQVASQTPENLTVVEHAAHLPIMRPLIGMDKIEITREAQALGSFESSIEPDQDCCSLFTPPHPVTRSNIETVTHIERAFDIPAMVKQGLEQAELVEIHVPPKRP